MSKDPAADDHSVPERGKDGLRWYGVSAMGRHPEKPERCVVAVHESGRGIWVHQCHRKRGHGPGGLYCKQHDPAYVQARQEKRYREWEEAVRAREKARRAPWEKLTLAEKEIVALREENDALRREIEALRGPKGQDPTNPEWRPK